jgi:uncharacterized membrane protein YvbJ
LLAHCCTESITKGMPAPDTCPNCGADVPQNARACPECGSDDSTGWSERATTQSLDLPDDEFNYEEFVEREFGTPKRSKKKLFWTIVAVLLLLSFLLLFIPRW